MTDRIEISLIYKIISQSSPNECNSYHTNAIHRRREKKKRKERKHSHTISKKRIEEYDKTCTTKERKRYRYTILLQFIR